MAAKTAAQATMGTYLMYKATTAATQYSKLVDIKNFPDLGGEPERVDVTTLSDRVRKYAMGVQDLSSFTFGANYIASDYQRIHALTGKQTEFALWIGDSENAGVYTPTGSDGQWAFTGDIAVYKAGGDVNAAQDMTITIFPSTEFVFSVPA